MEKFISKWQFFSFLTKRSYKGRLLTEISASKELSTPMKFSSTVTRNLRSGVCHLGELLAAWWWVCDIKALNLSLAERLNHSTLPFSSFQIVFCGHDFLCSSKMKKQEVLSDLTNLGWVHWCHTLVTRLLRVLQDGGPQFSNFGLL